ncbi:MAG: VWA domain-containing protein, partial [Deltaproteobacteria bacterium]|nr:VWA domain-containing protein [Deltaproteobacteria bacterium]
IVDPILQLPTVHDTLKMAQDVATYCEDYIEQQKQQQQEQQAADSEKGNESSAQDGEGSGSDHDSQSANGSASSDNSESDQDSQSVDGSANNDNTEPDKNSQSADGQTSDSDSLQGGNAIADMLDDILKADDSDFDGQDKGKAVSQYLSDKSEALPDNNASIVIPETMPARHNQEISLDSVMGASSKLRTRLTGLVQASKLKRNHPKQAGRRLDTRFINRIPTCDMRIFTSKQEKRAVNTAVLILIDRSTSMNGKKMEVARESALAAAIGVDSIPGASVCVGSFPVGYSDGVMEVLPFDQSPRYKYRNFGVSPNGGTPMAEAMWWGAAKLLARKEPRKLMIVATDGEANNPAAAKAAIERVTKNGIEMMGLGIMHHAVEHLFDEHRVIHSVEEMPAALIGMLQGKLKQG